MKRITSVLFALPIALSVGYVGLGLYTPAHAQRASQEIWDLHAELQDAVCQNDWNEALSLINPMLGFSNLSSQYRQSLVQFRQQVVGWRNQGRVFESQPNCDRPDAEQSMASRTTESPVSEGREASRERERGRNARSVQRRLSRPSAEVAANPRASECDSLEAIVNQIDDQARSLSQAEDFASIEALLRTLTELATLSDQAMLRLQAVSLTDFQLRRYQYYFISVYTQFGQATRGFVDAAGTGNQSSMEAKHNQIQQVTDRERELIEQVSRYCAQGA